MRLSYKVENKDGQRTIWWMPRSEAEEKEVDGRLLQYGFAINSCAREKWPTPNTPSGTLTFCEDPKAVDEPCGRQVAAKQKIQCNSE
jgi:hypothetical protein